METLSVLLSVGNVTQNNVYDKTPMEVTILSH